MSIVYMMYVCPEIADLFSCMNMFECATCVQLVCDKANLFASGCAAGRAFPLYNMKTGDCSQADAGEEAGESFLLYISPNTEDAPLAGEEAHALNCAIKGTRTVCTRSAPIACRSKLCSCTDCIVWTVVVAVCIHTYVCRICGACKHPHYQCWVWRDVVMTTV